MGLAAFVAACAAADGHGPFEEHTLLSLDGARQLPHARKELRDEAGLLACAVLAEGVAGWSVELAVRPDARGRGIGRQLLDDVLGHVCGHGGGSVRAWVHGPARAAHALADRYGARTVRRLMVLRRGLQDLPADVLPRRGAGPRPRRRRPAGASSLAEGVQRRVRGPRGQRRVDPR